MIPLKGENKMPVSVNFNRFWNYYCSTARKDYSGYSKQFFAAISKALEDLKLKDWRYPGDWPSTAIIKKNLTKICTRARVIMISNGVPAAERPICSNALKNG